MFKEFFHSSDGSTVEEPQSLVTIDVDFLWDCLQLPLARVATTGRFQGAFADHPEFTCQTMPGGIEIAGCAKHQSCAVLAENVMSISVAGYTPLHWCGVIVSAFCRQNYGIEPDFLEWDGGLRGELHLGGPAFVEFRSKSEPAIDPMWSGETLHGATLIIEVMPDPELV